MQAPCGTEIDFFYMPWDQRDTNRGFAFVNFQSPSAASQCQEHFTGRTFRFVQSKKRCVVIPAHVQGLQNNLRHHREIILDG